MLKGDCGNPTMDYPCYNKSYGSCNEVYYNKLWWGETIVYQSFPSQELMNVIEIMYS
jgi:hypothetical protein